MDVRCQLVFMPNHLTCERDVTKRDTIKTGAHQFTQHTTHVVSRQSSVRFAPYPWFFARLIVSLRLAPRRYSRSGYLKQVLVSTRLIVSLT